MNRLKVESSNIAEIGYDHDSMTLEIKFKGGTIYQYWPITTEGYRQLSKAESKGKYFSDHIRNNSQINVVKLDGEIQGQS